MPSRSCFPCSFAEFYKFLSTISQLILLPASLFSRYASDTIHPDPDTGHRPVVFYPKTQALGVAARNVCPGDSGPDAIRGGAGLEYDRRKFPRHRPGSGPDYVFGLVVPGGFGAVAIPEDAEIRGKTGATGEGKSIGSGNQDR